MMSTPTLPATYTDMHTCIATTDTVFIVISVKLQLLVWQSNLELKLCVRCKRHMFTVLYMLRKSLSIHKVEGLEYNEVSTESLLKNGTMETKLQ